MHNNSLKKRIIMTQNNNKNKNKILREETERERITEGQEQKGERNERFLPIFYWTD